MREIKTLKLNVTNIKSTLISGNKALKKLRSDEKIFSRNQQTRSKRIGKESFVEGKIPGSGMVGGVLQKMAAPAMSFIDKIKEFIGTVLLGIIVNNLPSIIRRVQEFLEKYKWVFDTLKNVLKVTGDLFMVLIDIFNYFNPKKEELKREREELEKTIADFIGATDETGKELDQTEKEVLEFVTESEKNEVVEDVIETIRQSSTADSKPITKKQFVTRASQYTRAKTSGGITAPITVPGIGTYQRTSPRGFLGMGEVEVATDTSGNKMDPKDFDKKFNTMIGSQNLIFETLKSEGVEGYADGGYVGGNSKPSGGSSGKAMTGGDKIARSSANTFLDLKGTVFKTERILDVKEDTHETLKDITKNFRTYLDLTKDKEEDDTSSPYKLPEQKPGQDPYQGPVIPSPSGLPAVEINPKDVIGTVGYTGYVVPKGADGTHIHIQNMDNYENGIPPSVKNNILVSGRPMPQQLRFTSGIGRRWGKMHKGEDYAGEPNQQITLTGGLKFLQFIPDQGDGYGNRVFIQDKNGTTYSLNHLNSGPSNLNELIKRQQNAGQGPTKKPTPQIVPISSGPNTKSYGKGGLDMLTQYYDGEGMSEVIIINSTQPIIVPMRR